MPIKIVSDGNPQTSFIEKDGVQLDNVTSIKINIEPDEIRAQVDFIFPELDLKLPHEIDSVKVGGETFVRQSRYKGRTYTWVEEVIDWMVWRFCLRPFNLRVKFVEYSLTPYIHILPYFSDAHLAGEFEFSESEFLRRSAILPGVANDWSRPEPESEWYMQYRVSLHDFGQGIRAGACVELNTLIIADKTGEIERERQRLGYVYGATRPHWGERIPARDDAGADPTGR